MPPILIESLPAGLPYEAVQIYTGSYPVDRRTLPGVRSLLNRLVQAASPDGLAGDVFLQHQYLPNAKEIFLQSLPVWAPKSGLGVWPDRPAPELWKTADLFRMAKGEDVPLMYRVFQLSGGPRAGIDAWEALLGSGMMMKLIHSGPVSSLLEAYKRFYLPGIQTPNLRIFPFYLPLLDANSVYGRDGQQLQQWLAGTRLYVRESPPDKSVLLVSSSPLQPLFQAVGAREAGKGRWSWSEDRGQ